MKGIIISGFFVVVTTLLLCAHLGVFEKRDNTVFELSGNAKLKLEDCDVRGKIVRK